MGGAANGSLVVRENSAVGTVLRHADGLPWWRVVNVAGRLAPGHERAQAWRLRNEGVAVSSNRVVGFGRRRLG